MSIASAITAAQEKVENAYTAVSNKGGTLPATQDLSNLPTAITSIPTGGPAPVINELNVVPSTSPQTITAPTGVDGYSPINVSAVTSSIDANIAAGNIKDGVTILGVAGSVVEANETTLNVTPSTSAQTLTPTGAYTGFDEVSVSAVTAAIDQNIVPSNIKKGTSILGVNGSCTELVGGVGIFTPRTTTIDETPTGGINGWTRIIINPVTAAIDSDIVSGNIKDGVSILGVVGSFVGGGAASITPFNLDSSGNVTKRSIPLTPTTFDEVVSIGNGAMQNAYANNTGISGALVMGQLVSVGLLGLNAAFTGCQNISSASFPYLAEVGTRGFENAFNYNYVGSSMASARFYSLKNIGSTAFNGAFTGCAGVEVYFDAVRPTTFSSYTNQLNSMFNNTGNNGATIHFPSNLQATVETLTGYPNFGANNGKLTILYDLPATVVLTGADTVNYERNPVADTSTALSWRVDGTNAKSTPYYTSGTNDPVVGDTIYSDAACTTVVTTVGSIA